MGYYVKLSPQHLTNCLKTTAGCNGGDTYRAIQEILTTPTKEVYTEASYPVNLYQILTESYILYSEHHLEKLKVHKWYDWKRGRMFDNK